MIWSVLAGGTAVFYALHGAWSLRVSRRIGSVPAAWALFAFALPFLGANLWWRGVPVVEGGFWGIWILNGFLNLAAWSLFFSALEGGDLGIIYPLLALTPLLVLPVELILIGDVPAPAGTAGIALIVFGVYLLNYRRGQSGPLEPIRALMADTGALKAIGVAFIWSIAGTLDRIAVMRSSPAFYAFMLAAGLSVLFLPLLLWSRRAGPADPGKTETRDGAARPPGDPVERARSRSDVHVASPGRFDPFSRKGAASLLLHGLLFAGMVVLQMEALSVALASYVLSIKRSGAILAVLIGYLVYREEALAPRLVGTAVTLVGSFILVVWG